MDMFVKYEWMCELVLGDGIEESSVYCLWGSFDAKWSWLVRHHVVACVIRICTGCG